MEALIYSWYSESFGGPPDNGDAADPGSRHGVGRLSDLRTAPGRLSVMRQVTMKRLSNLALLLLMSCASGDGSIERPAALLPGDQAEKASRPCSRPAPNHDGTWSPSEDDVAKAEADVAKVRRLRAGCCIVNARIDEPRSYYRQYVGITSGGRKLLSLNAYHSEISGWERIATVICDGGTGSWGAVYDPSSREFSELQVNGAS